MDGRNVAIEATLATALVSWATGEVRRSGLDESPEERNNGMEVEIPVLGARNLLGATTQRGGHVRSKEKEE